MMMPQSLKDPREPAPGSRAAALLPLRAGRVLVHRGVELEGGGAAVPGLWLWLVLGLGG